MSGLSVARRNTILSPTPKNTIILIGDSIIGQDTPTVVATDARINTKGAFQWANMLLRQRFDVMGGTDGLLGYKGVSGNTSAQVLARLWADVVAYSPGYCLVECGINDVTNDVASATTIANLNSIVTSLLDAGIKVLLCSLPPSSSVNSNARAKAWLEVNRWIMDRASVLHDVIYIDFSTPYLDVTAAFPQPLDTFTTEAGAGIHPNTKGAYALGKSIYRACKNIVPERLLFESAYNSTSTNANVLVPNPMMQGSGGTAGTGASGVIPALWTMAGITGGAVVGSKVARTDGVQGEWAQMAFTGDASYTMDLDYSQLDLTSNVNMPSGIAVGDVLQAFSELQISTGSTNFLGPDIRLRFIGGTFNWAYGFKWETAAEYIPLAEDIGSTESTVILATPKMPVPTGNTSFDLFLRMQPSAANSSFTTRHGRTCVTKAIS